MADRKASNKWIPPDFDPKKTSSINAYHGSHPLRERARKIKQGILVIRFEAPWNFWCESCGAHIGRGVRWNAEKKKVGAYYSTPIYAFTFTCHLCSNTIVFETDPKNCDYRITKGGRRKKDTWDADDAQSIVVPDQQEKDKRAQDPMYMLEHQASDKHRAAEQQPRLVRLVQLKEQTTKHDYDINSKLRNSFRQEKRKLKAKADKDNALLSKASLDIKLVPEDEGDVALAKHTTFGQHTPTTMRTARDAIKRQSIFSHAYTSSASKHSQSDNNSSNRSRSGGDSLVSSSAHSATRAGDLKKVLLAHARAGVAKGMMASKRGGAGAGLGGGAAAGGGGGLKTHKHQRQQQQQPLVRPVRRGHNAVDTTTTTTTGATTTAEPTATGVVTTVSEPTRQGQLSSSSSSSSTREGGSGGGLVDYDD